MERVKQAAETARTSFCAATLLGLADACRAYSREEGTPVVTALALMALFLGIGNFLDDRPVATTEVDTLLRRLELSPDLHPQAAPVQWRLRWKPYCSALHDP